MLILLPHPPTRFFSLSTPGKESHNSPLLLTWRPGTGDCHLYNLTLLLVCFLGSLFV